MALLLITEVALRRARLVLGWVTVSTLSRYVTSCSTQPGILRGCRRFTSEAWR